MRIVVPDRLRHAGEITDTTAQIDPRGGRLTDQTLDIDLRQCTFLRGPGALWCLSYALIAAHRGLSVRVLVPEHMGVCIWMKSVGLISLLQQNGVEVDDRGIPDRRDPQVVLPLTRFNTATEAEDLINHAFDVVTASGLGTANIRPIVSETLGELVTNVAEHAESPIGGYALIQYYEFQAGESRRFGCAVADGGIGIRRSLEKNPAMRTVLNYDWEAVEYAVRERVSSSGRPNRGNGLFGVAEDMRLPDRTLLIHSGLGSLEIREGALDVRRNRLFPGTLAYASVAT